MSTTIRAIPRTDLNSNTLGGAGWSAINPNGIPNICFKLRISNSSTVGIEISYDGITAHDFLIAGLDADIDGQSFHREPSEEASWAKGQIVYVKAAGAGVGMIRLAGYYV